MKAKPTAARMPEPAAAGAVPPSERPIAQVRGTRDWLPGEFVKLRALEGALLEHFARAGYEPMRTPVLEDTELHERKSGAAIVSKLYELTGERQGTGRLCLRPELTASIVRAFTAAEPPPALPWRVSLAGPVFRYERPQPGHYREFQQVGVELLGASGPAADGEVIWLADWSLAALGVASVTVRLGHVGLILELLQRSGLPASSRSALVEMLSDAASEGRNVRALEQGLEQLAGWLDEADAREAPPELGAGGQREVDRLFRTLVPDVTGRRSGHEILHRLRGKWDLGHSLRGALTTVRAHLHQLADLRGPAASVLDRLGREYRDLAPDSITALRDLVQALEDYGIDRDRVELDLGFGRGIGFYSQMVFELIAETPGGPVEVCGGGRYDGLARVLGSARDDRGVGFAVGLERLLQVLEAQGTPGPAPEPSGYLVRAADADARAEAIHLATFLRRKGIRAVLETERPDGEAALHAAELALAEMITVRGNLEDPDSLLVRSLTAGARDVEVALPELVQRARVETGGRPR